MELLPTRRRTIGLSDTTNAIALRKKTDAVNLLKNWSPSQQQYCADNISKSADVPTLVTVSNAFGIDTSEMLLLAQINDAKLFLDLKLDETSSRNIAHAIAADNKLRRLNLASILAFFHKLKCGQYKQYGATTRGILEAMQEYFPAAFDAQCRAVSNQDKRDKATEKHVTFAEFAKSKGMPYNSVSEYLAAVFVSKG
jgi:hypothetical protein